MGYTNATRAGISISIFDMQIPAKKDAFVKDAQDQVQEIENQYTEGLITDGERYNKVIDIWSRVSEDLEGELMNEIASEDVKPEGGGESRRDAWRWVLGEQAAIAEDAFETCGLFSGRGLTCST